MLRKSIGIKRCEHCGLQFATDLRGGAKWCFACKVILYKAYRKGYRRRSRRGQHDGLHATP